MQSACPDPDLVAAKRHDPYWDGLWSAGSNAAWAEASVSRLQEEAGRPKLQHYLRTNARPHDFSWVQSDTFRPMKLAALSVVDSWRNATSEQLAAFTGIHRFASGRDNALTGLFQNGLIDVGGFAHGTRSSFGELRGALYRPARNRVFENSVQPLLTRPEWLSVTGGLPWGSGRQYERHNVLAAEFGLRVAEYGEIASVLGEKISTVDLLAHSGLGLPRTSSQMTADLTLVRTDGARIAVELTASASGTAFDAKVARWARLLADRPMSDSGLTVLFLCVNRQDVQDRDGTNSILATVRKAITAAVRSSPGTSANRVAERMFLADWQDWFPVRGAAAPGFQTLDCERPTGPATDLWEPASLLDIFDVPFNPRGSFQPLALAENASLLGSVPYWLRRGHEPVPLWEAALGHLGNGGAPTKTGSENSLGRPHAPGFPGVGPAKPPLRLRNFV
ncbi:hypothetical protein [Cryobacterium sp. Y62]|uniref:hypothetical protein n=1 Tax=Cryobacterium sp. Y62 TaxID=2048284 RepID=UPI000CE3F67C|nr:hypothetical protein [Cryobacterium sp. Y62]